MSERRIEARFLCADLVKVDWVADEAAAGESGQLRTAEGVLEDISAQGACVQVEERISLGVAISISAGYSEDDSGHPRSGEPARFSGYVSYCERRDYGYYVGIRLSEDTQWSSLKFEPQHLTNLATLLRMGGRRPRRKMLVE
jgi:hypothetical protein